MTLVCTVLLSSCNKIFPFLPNRGNGEEDAGGQELPQYSKNLFTDSGVYNGKPFEVSLTDKGREVYGADAKFRAEVYEIGRAHV